MALLETQSVTVEYPDGDVRALDDVSLQINAGEHVAIVGPSGSGKSTLLSLLGTLSSPTSGTVLFDGTPVDEIRDLDSLRSSRLGFVFQSFFLLPTLTAAENVQVPMMATAATRRQRIDRAASLIEQVGLTSRIDHLPGQLSVGQRQRVAIARALANGPSVLLADEPTGNLDSEASREVLALFDQLRRDHALTLIVVTHSDAVAQSADRIVRIVDGRIALDSAGQTG